MRSLSFECGFCDNVTNIQLNCVEIVDEKWFPTLNDSSSKSRDEFKEYSRDDIAKRNVW